MLNMLRMSTGAMSVVLVVLLIAGCGDSSSGNIASNVTTPSTGGLPAPLAANVVPVTVGRGAVGTPNVPTINVTICVPGSTTQCQTVDNIQVDSQSYGLRIFNSALSPQLANALPIAQVAEGQLAECLSFTSGFTWGSVRTADLKIGGESANNLRIHVLGDLSAESIPPSCAQSSGGHSENSPADFGANGVIGVGVQPYDCGQNCSADREQYFSCSSSVCNATAVTLEQQIANPVSRFPVDNNGIILKLGAAPDSGAASINGTMTFGIGTRANNALTSAQTVLTTDANGNLAMSLYNGTSVRAFLDSGTSTISVNDSTLPLCPADVGHDYYCPATTQTRSGTLVGQNGVSSAVSLNIANAQTLFSNPSNFAFNDLVSDGGPGVLNLGLPFFFGRTIYSGMDQTASGGPAPFVAF
ncbi:DUF3443 domain-containing protein [Burkholderia ubonensis]|uniref:DUF3443 domain-containing protein n=1 Tax=Burkholderia ubonensis TaxID=101571 RepID=UPI0009B45607|nr:DUF3443 domain-containing protein [Burkholderia ubonensis]